MRVAVTFPVINGMEKESEFFQYHVAQGANFAVHVLVTTFDDFDPRKSKAPPVKFEVFTNIAAANLWVEQLKELPELETALVVISPVVLDAPDFYDKKFAHN